MTAENIITEKEYSIGFEQCKSMIHGVCRQCGGELQPLETVDNSGNPTFWAGCDKCEIFCWGVSKETFSIAEYLVDKRHYVAYSHMDRPADRPNSSWYVEHFRASQISGACYIVDDVLFIQKQLIESGSITQHKTEIKMQKEVVKPEQTEQPSEKPGEQTVANETPQETEVDGDELENDSDE